MTFDNGKTIIRLRLRLFIATLVMLVYLYFVYFGKQLKFPVFGIEEYFATLFLSFTYILLAFLPLILKYNYIYFSNDGTKIIFRYYLVGIVSRKKNSIEIPKQEFLGYKINKKLFGFIKSIQLYRLMKNRKASYTPIFLSSLSRKELNRIIDELDKYQKPLIK